MLNPLTHRTPPASPRRHAFTLIELMVVIGIIVILTAVTLPAVKALTKGNSQAQATNMIRAAIASARSIALAQHRQAGLVFFDESSSFSSPVNTNQTAVQIFVEDFNQAQYTSANTIYVAYSNERQYLPSDVMVGAVGAPVTGNAEDIKTGDNIASGVGAIARCILFNSDGQMIINSNLSTPLTTGNYDSTKLGQYPTAYGDWRFTNRTSTRVTAPVYIPGNASSAPAIVIFNKNDYLQQNFAQGTAGSTARTNWLEQHSDCIVINAYTGNIIR